MCGINAIIGDISREEGKQRILEMNKAMWHRGPDDGGAFSKNGFAFGMRRLSIIDLETGSQPMFLEDGTGIIYNGETYNYRELREQLENEGVDFETHSDTEVVLRAFREWGPSCFEKLNGMFAFCIFHPQAEKVYIVRDRLGIKPLYFSIEEGRICLSSEMKSLRLGMKRCPEIDRTGLAYYMGFRYIPGPHSIWENVSKLDPGHWASIDLKSLKFDLKSFWKLKFDSEPCEPSRDYVHEFKDLFLGSVEKRLVASDVPVGILLSGGLDSSAVCAAAKELGHKDYHSFSVGFEEGGDFNEQSFAREVAKHVHSKHHEVKLGKDEFLNLLPEVIKMSDEPLADLASIPLMLVCKLAQQHVKVVLSGEGSDEVLGGYDMEVVAKKLDLLGRVPGKLISVLSRIPLSSFEKFKVLASGGVSCYLKNQRSYMTKFWSNEELLHSGLKLPTMTSEDLIASWYDKCESTQPLDQLQQTYCQSWLVDDLLMKADKMSMLNSLELRVPFLDHELVEWAERLPVIWKVGSSQSGYSSKRILREYAASRLPAGILNRKKLGFPVPAYHWLSDSLYSWAEEILLSSTNKLSNHMETSFFRNVLKHSRQGGIEASHKVWVAIVLELWLREHS